MIVEYNSLDELLEKTENIKGKCLNDLVSDENLFNNEEKFHKRKGVLGDLVETEFYGYANNNVSKADFEKLGIELKTTGLKINKNGTVSAKERLALSMINYFDLVNETFESSHLLEKNEKILILWYIYIKKVKVRDLKFVEYFIFCLLRDKDIIKNDYNIIQEKVKKGLAHELSEGDTTYLGAFTKASNGSVTRVQPNSQVLAKPRAFCLKQSYMTSIIRNHCDGGSKISHEYVSIMDYVYKKLKPYLGKSQLEIADEIGLRFDKVPKNLNKMISDKLIGKEKDLEKEFDIFKNSLYLIKNSPVQSDFWPLERMTFPVLRVSQFDLDWDESYWKSYFEQVTIIVICYEGNRNTKNGYRILKDVKKISFNDNDLESIKIAFNSIKDAINKYKTDKVKRSMDSYFKFLPTPNKFPNQIIEITPKASRGKNSYQNFFTEGDSTKTAFALTKPLLYEKFKLS